MNQFKLSPENLRAYCEKPVLEEVLSQVEKPEDTIIGQNRALKALEFGLGIKSNGFNIYVAGVPGTGKETAVKEYVEEVARRCDSPDDICYVNNFKDPYRPCILRVPPGKGVELAKDVKQLIDTAREEIPRSFESDDYINQKESITKHYNEQKQNLFNNLNEKTMQEGFLVQQTPAGFVFVPKKEDGSPMKDEEVMALSEEKREELREKRKMLEDELKTIMREIRNLDRKAQEEIKELDQKVILFAVEHLFNDLLEKYADYPRVTNYLKNMQEDIVENVELFRQKEQQQQSQQQMQIQPFASSPHPWSQEPHFRKYEVNVIVDNSDQEGAPVVMEMNPTYQNIFGRIEKEAQFGAFHTDFTMIKGGSLHQANGGFFVVTVEDLLKNPLSWESLKRVLKNQELEIEEAAERYGLMSTKSLRPQPVPLNVKVVLIGSSYLYYLLYHLDSDFKELFKVKAEFDDIMDRTSENLQNYIFFVRNFCQKEGLSSLDKSAIKKVIEYGSRLARDQKKLSTRFSEIADVIREACYYATREGANDVSDRHINQAVEAKEYRSNLIQEKIQEAIDRNLILIDTEGQTTGQVNGLSVGTVGDFSFGKPTRITCSVGLGRSGIIDIERESKLGGRIHSKGVMILSGYLNATYAEEMPLTLSARLVFEQNYSEIEGDSASCAELCALLSELSGLPIKQDLAITGSVNQKGAVQAIGGVNEKIEGFFEICRKRGFNGQQGVIVPKANEENLMLKEEIVNAVKEGHFHIYSVQHVNEALEILTGVQGGEKQADGTFDPESVNEKARQSLHDIAIKLKRFGKEESQKEEEENDESNN